MYRIKKIVRENNIAKLIAEELGVKPQSVYAVINNKSIPHWNTRIKYKDVINKILDTDYSVVFLFEKIENNS